jgi:hypothetical protein
MIHKFWEELITYFPFTVIIVFDTSRKKTLVYMHNEVNTTIQYGMAAVLVLLMGVIYEIHCWDGLRWHDKHTKFHEDWYWHSGNIKVITLDNMRGCSVGISDERNFLGIIGIFSLLSLHNHFWHKLSHIKSCSKCISHVPFWNKK